MPTPLRVVRPEVPVEVEAAIARALARTPADRFATAAEFAAGLAAGAVWQSSTSTMGAPGSPQTRRRAAPIALLALVLGFAIGLGVLFAWRRGDHADASPVETNVRRIAVLPFDNLGDTSQAYFADGVSDAVRGKLTALPGLVVIARTSSIQYRGGSKPPRDIATELGVRYLLTGAVRWAKARDGTSRVQVSPELIEITNGAPESRWAQPFDAALTDVFLVQADVAGKVAEALGVALASGAQKALTARPTQSIAAYDDFLRGEALYVTTGAFDPASLLRAEDWYRRAIGKDSSFALAWAQLSSVRTSLYPWDRSAKRALESREAVDRALTLDPDLSEAQRALAEHLWMIGQNETAALAAAHRAHELNRGDVEALGLLAYLAPSDSQLTYLQRARDLDPRYVATAIRLAQVLLYERRYEDAWSEAERGLDFAPANPSLVMTKVRVRLARGDQSGAQKVLQEALPRSGTAQLIRYWDLTWFLTGEQIRTLLDLPGESWPGWQYRSGILALEAFAIGDSARARAYSDSAITGITGYLATEPDPAFNYWARGLHLANLGRIQEAKADRDRVVARLNPDDSDMRLILAWLDVILDDKSAAVALLDQVLRGRHYVNRAWLRIDDRFAPLCGYPPFDRLVAGP
jgi:TolB-like protein/Tfp pilus assembly protein PilF